jgi:hypothetical protein
LAIQTCLIIEDTRNARREDSAILSGYQLFHNYVRPHEGLDGNTPAEACGIKIEGQDKWKTLIENASKKSQAAVFDLTGVDLTDSIITPL